MSARQDSRTAFGITPAIYFPSRSEVSSSGLRERVFSSALRNLCSVGSPLSARTINPNVRTLFSQQRVFTGTVDSEDSSKSLPELGYHDDASGDLTDNPGKFDLPSDLTDNPLVDLRSSELEKLELPSDFPFSEDEDRAFPCSNYNTPKIDSHSKSGTEASSPSSKSGTEASSPSPSVASQNNISGCGSSMNSDGDLSNDRGYTSHSDTSSNYCFSLNSTSILMKIDALGMLDDQFVNESPTVRSYADKDFGADSELDSTENDLRCPTPFKKRRPNASGVHSSSKQNSFVALSFNNEYSSSEGRSGSKNISESKVENLEESSKAMQYEYVTHDKQNYHSNAMALAQSEQLQEPDVNKNDRKEIQLVKASMDKLRQSLFKNNTTGKPSNADRIVRKPSKPTPKKKPEQPVRENYRAPRRQKPRPYVTDNMYKFLEEKLAPTFKLEARIEAEEFVDFMCKQIDTVIKRKSNYHSIVNSLLKRMVELKITKRRIDFHCFIEKYLPYEFREKAIPCFGCNLGPPSISYEDLYKNLC